MSLGSLTPTSEPLGRTIKPLISLMPGSVSPLVQPSFGPCDRGQVTPVSEPLCPQAHNERVEQVISQGSPPTLTKPLQTPPLC